MARHRIPFKYSNAEDDTAIELAFSKKKIEERKQWLTNWMEERKRRAEMSLPELYLYGKDTKKVTYNEFVNRELVLFSNMDNERSIPSLVDGFKPGQRKVVFTCLKRNLTKEIKVAQLAGSVAEHSAYHHGEQSLMATIVNLAQNFVGSNNINVLMPIGQFGTRLQGGKDSASPRYIFTMLSPLARHAFNVQDEPLLRHLRDDNLRIEPEWYIPVIPMVLVNGAEGIGTGWSTKIPNYNVREIVSNLRRMLDGQQPTDMVPSFKNFRGTIEVIDNERYVTSGEIAILDDQTIEITELPIRTWTQSYKESVLEPMLQGTDKTPAFITDYKDYCTDSTVRFVVKMSADNLSKASQAGLHRTFKLQTTLSISSMVLFDAASCIKRYTSVTEILREFYDLRLKYYVKRKEYMEGMLSAESLKLANQARFICEKIEGRIGIEKKSVKEMVQTMVRAKYDSDPVKAWKEAQKKIMREMEKADHVSDTEDEAEDETSDSKGPDYNYILNMSLWSLTNEKRDALLKLRDEKAEELRMLRSRTPPDLWKEDLDKLVAELDKVEKREHEDEAAGTQKHAGGSGDGKGKHRPKKLPMSETKPSSMGERVVPVIDATLRAKVEAAAAKKLKAKERREAGFDDGDVSDTEMRPLSERVGAIDGPDAKPAKKGRKRKLTAPDGPKKPTVISSSNPPKSRSPAKKKGKKRNPWSDSEGSEADNSDASDLDMDGSFVNVIEREKAPRRAAASKVQYKFDEDEDDDGDDDDIIAGGGAAAGPQNSRDSSSDDGGKDSDFNPAVSDDDDEDSRPAPAPAAVQSPRKAQGTSAASRKLGDKQAVKKTSAAVSKSATSTNSNDPWRVVVSSSDSDTAKAAPPAKAKKTTAGAGRKKAVDLDSSSDFDFAVSKPKKQLMSKAEPKANASKPKATKAPKKMVVSSDMDSSDAESSGKKKAAQAARGSKKAKRDDDEFDVADVSDIQPRARSGRSAKPVNYHFDSDDDDDDM